MNATVIIPGTMKTEPISMKRITDIEFTHGTYGFSIEFCRGQLFPSDNKNFQYDNQYSIRNYRTVTHTSAKRLMNLLNHLELLPDVVGIYTNKAQDKIPAYSLINLVYHVDTERRLYK